jgi:thiol-disulfide isomerase/thioredoxin
MVMFRRAARLVLVAFVAALASACSPPEERHDGPFPPIKSLKVLGKLPGTLSVTALDGTEIDMNQLRGKVVFINRWGTFCPPCVAEMPGIEALYESVKDDVAFLIITTESAAKVREFVKKKGWKLPIHIATERLPPVINPQFIPASYVVNRKGEVVFEAEGMMDWDTDQARKFLKNIP